MRKGFPMDRIKRWLNRLDTPFEYLGVGLLAAMVLIVTWQVFSRAIFNAAPRWSEEVSLILMIWVAFLGIAIGFRERVHIAVGIFVDRLPEGAQNWVQRFIYALVFAFGLYLLVQGWQFTLQTSRATLPSTGLPRSALYAVLPISGLMICVYTALQALGVRTEKYRDPESVEEAPEGRVE
jgi:TRAP-type C4-dicarboxylate transport system permease small subunit